MYLVGDGMTIVIFLFVGCLHHEVYGITINRCSISANGTLSVCETITRSTTQPEEDTEDEFCCRTIVYIFIVGFGILTLPLIVCTRICWIKKLRMREQRQLDGVRNRQRLTNEQSVFTVEPAINICDFIVSPPPYDVISSPEEAPPPYESPPPYTPKESVKEVA